MKIFILPEFFNDLKTFFSLDSRKKKTHTEKTSKMDVYNTASKFYNDEYYEYFFKF